MNSLFINKTYSRQQLKGLLEAVLFVYGKPVDSAKICMWFELSKEQIDQMVDELNISYQERSAGFCILPVAGGYQIMTNPSFKEELRELFGSKDENKLSQTVMEILAIIAYKQPVSKEEIDKIRGVNSSRSLNILIGLKLIDVVGSDNLLGDILYGTSKRFLEVFRLKSLNDLPSPESLELNEVLESGLEEIEFDDSLQNEFDEE
ncbi:MAG: SMC-Scp complex subunit ScpB [Brevinemataceae bacterium]